LWARGLGHNVAGFDISRSVGLGKLVPGTEALAHPRDSAAETIGTMAIDMAGPTGSLIKFGVDLLISDRPVGDTMTKLPGGLGNIWTAYKWSQEGVRAPSMAQVTHDEQTGKLRDLTAGEIVGKALGFNPLVVSQGRETAWNQYDQKMYWQGRRKHLTDDYYRAWVLKDREGMADVRKAVTRYNENVPGEYRSLRITSGDLSRSVQAHERQRRAEEAQTTPQRRYKPLYREIRESYESP
jgi:hypothetical protein